jgi:uncharacterized protein DUF6526
MADAPQSFEKHTRWDPWYHFFLVPVALITFFWAGYNAYELRTAWAHWEIIGAIALIVAVAKIRLYPLKAQDRVIRLEERLRLSSLVTPEFRPRINELTERQLVALRFASDAELPALAKRALEEKLEPKQIKAAIKSWRADDFRV